MGSSQTLRSNSASVVFLWVSDLTSPCQGFIIYKSAENKVPVLQACCDDWMSLHM